jgi:hypothetical protein
MIFGPSKKSERRDEEMAATLVEVTEALAFEPVRRRFFRRFLILNLAVWAIAGIFSGWLYRIFTEVMSLTDTPGLIAVGTPFVLGFYAAYAFLRIRLPDVEDNKQLESDMMSTYQYNVDSTRRWYVWIGAILFGLLNALGVVMFVYLLAG